MRLITTQMSIIYLYHKFQKNSFLNFVLNQTPSHKMDERIKVFRITFLHVILIEPHPLLAPSIIIIQYKQTGAFGGLLRNDQIITSYTLNLSSTSATCTFCWMVSFLFYHKIFLTFWEDNISWEHTIFKKKKR